MWEYAPTLEDSYCMQAVIDGKSCCLCITDTCGMMEHSFMLERQIRAADGFLCVYSVDMMDTFNCMKLYMDKIRLLSNAPVILVGNKCDLAMNEERKVDNRFGQSCAAEYGVTFFTTSAMTGKSFHTLVRLIRNSNVPAETATKHCCTIC
jgi:small GTP-binding protein